LIARRSQYHQSVLAGYTRTPRFDAAVTGLATRLTHVGLSANYAHRQALARMYAVLMGQAQAISYVEVYWLLAMLSLLMFFLSFLLAKNHPGAGGQVAMH
jgi:MFS transporter, DHA2 family, multidrug resistance protein